MFRGRVLLLDNGETGQPWLDDSTEALVRERWGVSSETDRLRDVLLSTPEHLAPVPCCAVTIRNLRAGFPYSAADAAAQHRGLAAALTEAGVRCHFVPAAPNLPDLTFTRDASLMTPWGLVELSPAAGHRREEVAAVRRAASALGVPTFARIARGTIEGGDIAMVRPGLAIVGSSGSRTCEDGASEVRGLFEAQGWRTILYRFDPHFLHLDTQFCMIDDQRALACVDVIDDAFMAELTGLGIELVPVSYKEAQRLGCNILSLGGGRVVAAAENETVNARLRRLGYEIIAVELEQLTRCGGGVHCLTMPLRRS